MKYIYKNAFSLNPKNLVTNLKKFWQESGNRMLVMTALSPIIAATTGIFVNAVIDQIQKATSLKKEPVFFKKMLDKHPELLNADPKQVGDLWASLYHHAPNMAEDPLAAGAFIRQSIARGVLEESGGPSPDTYKTLGEIQEGFVKNKKDNNLADWQKHLSELIVSNYGKQTLEPSALALLNPKGFTNDKPGVTAVIKHLYGPNIEKQMWA